MLLAFDPHVFNEYYTDKLLEQFVSLFFFQTSVAPTSAPNCGDVPLYESGKTWEDDEQQVYVADGTVYQCKGGVYKFWCDNAAYAPDGQYGNQAWNEVGSC